MNQNFYSAFARVSDGSGENSNQQHGGVAPYGQLGPFPMHQMPMFPTATLANNSNSHHQAANSNGEGQHQRNSQQQAAGSSWIQQTPPSGSISAAQLQRTLVQTSGANSNHIGGTALGEWTGQEWIPPQHSTIAALAGGSAVQTVVPTTYTMLGGINWSESANSQQQPTTATTTTVPSTQTQSVHFTELQVPPKQKGRRGRKSAAQQAAQVQNDNIQQQRSGNISDDDMLSPDQLAKVAMSKSRQIRPTYSSPAQPTAGSSQQPEQNITTVHTPLAHPIIQYNKPEPPPRPQRDPKPFDGRYAICPNCGTQSADYLDCESCNFMLPDEVKMYDPEAAKIAETARKEELKKQATEKLLLHKLKLEKEKRLKMAAEAATKPQTRTTRASTSGSPTKASTSFSRRVSTQSADNDWTAPVRSRRRGGGPKRSRQAEVYILSSHSSDEDTEEEVYIPSPNRRAPAQPSQPPQPAAAPVTTRTTRASQQAQRPDFTHVPELYVRCVKITMGTLTGTPREPLHIALTGVDIHIETETETVKIRLDNRDIKECLGCVQKTLAVLFIRANRIFGEKVRGALQMVEPVEGNERYYNPESADARYKYIIVHLDTQHTISNLAHRLNDVFRAISLSYQTGGVLFRFIELNKAQRLLGLIRGESDSEDVSSSHILDNIVRSMDDESDEQRSVPQFSGPVKKLFVFPFPPARGLWIDNQDRFCLTEGEFLNDNIITFYLNYLYEKVLTPAQRDRTYIFSTFFYTKLSQRVSNQGLKDAAKKTAAEKRHYRVKTWTKNVDIFDKDFIIVPINEASHWFLAIICYPGLQAAEYYPEETPAEPERVVVQEPVVNDRDGISSTTAEVNGVANGPNGGNNAVAQAADPQVDFDSDDEFVGGFEYEDEDVQPDSQNAGHKVKKRPCILIFDSLMMPPGQNIAVKRLREYLDCEWTVKHPTEQRSFTRELVPGSNSKCPQQDNYSDCGIYLLQYVESFFKNPIQDYSLPMTWTVDWFEHSVIKNKRGQIRSLIDSLKTEYDELYPPQPKKTRVRAKKQASPTKAATSPKKARLSPPAKKAEVTKETSVPEALGLASSKLQLSVSLERFDVSIETSSTGKPVNDDMDAPTDTEPDTAEVKPIVAPADAANSYAPAAPASNENSESEQNPETGEKSAEPIVENSVDEITNGEATYDEDSQELSGKHNSSFASKEEDNSDSMEGERRHDTALEDNSKMAVELENIESSVGMGSGDGAQTQPMQTE